MNPLFFILPGKRGVSLSTVCAAFAQEVEAQGVVCTQQKLVGPQGLWTRVYLEERIAAGEEEALLEEAVGLLEEARQKAALVLEGIEMEGGELYLPSLHRALSLALATPPIVVVRKAPSLSTTLGIATQTYGKIAGALMVEEAFPEEPLLSPLPVPFLGALLLSKNLSPSVLKLDPSFSSLLCAPSASAPLSGPLFRSRLLQRARLAKKILVLPEGEELRILSAASLAVQQQIAQPLLLGHRGKIERRAAQHGISLEGITVVDPTSLQNELLLPLLERRRHKGLTEVQAQEMLRDPIVVGTLLVAEGRVDGLVAGAVRTTADTLRPALMLLKTNRRKKKKKTS